MIRLVGITQHYGVRPVLEHLDLEIPTGELAVVLGPNGMGKSTLLGVMAGVLHPQRGHVEIDGRRRHQSVADELAIRKRVVYLPDHPWLPKNRTGREFLLAVGRLYDVEENHLIDHVERLLQVFDLGREGDWPIHSYSNGQQKKVAICSALVTEAPVLLLDEPFSGGLDPSGILVLKRLLQRRAHDEGGTVVLTTPVPELVEQLADRIVILQHGRIVACDTVAGLRQRADGADGSGPLGAVLERLMHPETLANLEHYFHEEAK